MKNNNLFLLSSVFAMSLFGITSVSAAPSVRMLGANATRVGTNAAVVKSDNNTAVSIQRVGSIRAKNVASNAPVAINTVAKINNQDDKDEQARLSFGKYIHSLGTASASGQPKSTGASVPATSSSDFVNLVDRVANLENNAALSVGEGLTLENNTITLDGNIAALQTTVSDLQDAVDTKMAKADTYTKTEVDTIVESIGSDINHTYQATVPIGSNTSETFANIWLQ